MHTDEQIIAAVQEKLSGKVLEVTLQSPRRIHVKADPEHLCDVLAFLRKEYSITHMSTISGVDLGEHFEFIYHMANLYTNVNVRILTPRNDPKIPTTTGVIPGAILYERELQDMFGVKIENIPDSRPLLLADDWPQGEYPLRKDFKWEGFCEEIPGGE